MATISYQCNKCNRTIQKQENKSGITVFGKCIITEGCLGQLYKLSRNMDNSRESFPFSVGGLIDYTPRKAFYEHTQTLLATSWLVTHNLSTSPAVSVYAEDVNGDLKQLNQDNFTIQILNKNQINLVFTQPFKGIAQCIARSTTTTVVSSVAQSTQVRVTNNGLLTLAIPELIVNPPPVPTIQMESLPFSLEIIIQRPSQEPVSSSENITKDLSDESPWNDWPKILIRKRKNYVVRAKEISNFIAFNSNSTITDIPNGTRIQFTRILWPASPYRIIQSRELLFLLANSPYEPIDKIRDKIIDVGEMIDSPINYFTYRDGELYVDSSVIESTYPSTIKVS
jgi:hypothetical protein